MALVRHHDAKFRSLHLRADGGVDEERVGDDDDSRLWTRDGGAPAVANDADVAGAEQTVEPQLEGVHPGPTHGGRDHHQGGPLVGVVREDGERLEGLAKTHVVGDERAATLAEDELDALALKGEERGGEARGAQGYRGERAVERLGVHGRGRGRGLGRAVVHLGPLLVVGRGGSGGADARALPRRRLRANLVHQPRGLAPGHGAGGRKAPRGATGSAPEARVARSDARRRAAR